MYYILTTRSKIENFSRPYMQEVTQIFGVYTSLEKAQSILELYKQRASDEIIEMHVLNKSPEQSLFKNMKDVITDDDFNIVKNGENEMIAVKGVGTVYYDMYDYFYENNLFAEPVATYEK